MKQSSAPAERSARGRFTRAALRVSGTGAFFALTLYLIEPADVGARLAALDTAWLAAGALLSLPLYLLMATRWWFTAARVGAPIGFRSALGEYYASTLLNRVLPLSIAGDAVRVMRHSRRLADAGIERSLGPAVRAALLDRVSSQLALSSIMAVAAIVWLGRGYTRIAPFAIAGALVLGGAGLVALIVSRRRFGGAMAEQLARDARAALVDRGALGVQLALSSAVVALLIATFYCAGRAAGSRLDLVTVVQVAPLVLGSTFLPVAFAGWGVREAAAAALFGALGLAPDAGVATSVAFGLLALATALPGLFVLLWPAPSERRRDASPAGGVHVEPLAHALWMGAAVAASALAGDPRWFAVAGALALAARVVRGRGAWTPGGSFGAANAVTSLRVAAIASLAFAFDGVPWWGAVGAVAGVFALDGLDGWLARRHQTASAFGAVYDLETDAYLVMLLCLLLWSHDVAGAWVLSAGLWRYVYAAVIAVSPGVQPAPRSRLGRSVYAILMVSLCGALLPLPALAAPLAAAGTILVTLSFLRSFSYAFGLRGGVPARSP